MSNRSAIECYNEGLQRAKEKKWDEAIELLSEAIVKNPKHANSYNVLGKVYIQKGNLDTARKCWRKALKIDPDNVTARQCLAAIGNGSGRTWARKILWPAAVVILLAALIISNLVLLGRIGRLEAELAKATADQIVSKTPVLSKSSYHEPQQTESSEPIETSTDQEGLPDEPATVTEDVSTQGRPMILPTFSTDSQVTEAYEQALADCRSGNYDQAIEIFQRVLKYLQPHELKDNAQYWLAECYYAKKEYDRALTEFQKVKMYFPKANKVFDAELKVAYSYHRLGRMEEAKQQLLQLSEDWPHQQYQARIAPLLSEVR